MKIELNNLEKLELTMNVLCKRILPAYFFTNSPEKFLKWQGNFCKQAAILGSVVIDNFLETEDYEPAEAYEGFFSHERLGDYNHCSNYIKHKTDPSKNIICDFTSTITYMDYCTENDPILHIQGSEKSVTKDSSKITLIATEQLDIEYNLNQEEFYTGEKGDEIVQSIKHLLKMANLWEDKPIALQEF